MEIVVIFFSGAVLKDYVVAVLLIFLCAVPLVELFSKNQVRNFDKDE